MRTLNGFLCDVVRDDGAGEVCRERATYKFRAPEQGYSLHLCTEHAGVIDKSGRPYLKPLLSALFG